jgi:hypothetical protein
MENFYNVAFYSIIFLYNNNSNNNNNNKRVFGCRGALEKELFQINLSSYIVAGLEMVRFLIQESYKIFGNNNQKPENWGSLDMYLYYFIFILLFIYLFFFEE